MFCVFEKYTSVSYEGGVEELLTKTGNLFVKAQTQVYMFADLFPS